MPEIYHVEQITSGCNNNELTLLMRWNGAKMVVNIDRNLSSDVAENLLIDKYMSVYLDGDEDGIDAVQDDLLDAVNEAGHVLLDQLAPPSILNSSDLHSALFPPQFSFNLVTVGGEVKLFSEGSHLLEKTEISGEGYKSAVPVIGFELSNTSSPPFQYQLEIKDGLKLPRHQTTDIRIVEKLLGDGYISHVCVEGHDMCAKVGRDFDSEAIQRELDCLSRISTLAAQQNSKVNIPKLLGLIETADDEKVIGILEELIPQPKSQELSSLAMIQDVSAIPKQRREAWASQVRWTVGWLHENGIVWGDAKAANVLIHSQTDETWIIDFGGGTTRGWVDENLAGTVEGDNQAVGKIFDLLEVDI
ncbi:hypothetical protein G7046_g2882 [Stylonectria norvegica]|nr:hypothetical protein G7046_g2882 [Stylonectria norvegica]